MTVRTCLFGGLLTASLVLWTPALAQQDTLLEHYMRTIQQPDLRAHLEVLASDGYEGRETGAQGQKMAAAYIRNAFASFGIAPVPRWEEKGLIAPGYEQPFNVVLVRPGGIRMEVNGHKAVFLQDQFYFNERLREDLRVEEVVFMGDGLVGPKGDPYVNADTRDKVVLVMGPSAERSEEVVSTFFTGMTMRTMLAKKAGAKVLLFATPDADRVMQEMRHHVGASRMRLQEASVDGTPSGEMQVVIVDQALAEGMLARSGITWKKASKGKVRPGAVLPCEVILRRVPNEQVLQAENVLGYVEGSDLKNELVVVTAHYDHIGTDGGEVYNGADDDGSGTVALLEMAQAFAQARAEGHGPRRSLLFMPVSGEEKGLLGSAYYTDHPVFPLASTVADLNIDMIGRFDTAHQDAAPYVYIIGSDRLSTDLHRINDEANRKHVGLELDYRFNAADDPNRFYYRSDHYNFARYGVPVIFYFSGVHEDYHRPGDEVDKIRFDLLEQRARLVFATAWELANRTARIAVDKPVKEEGGR